MNPLRRHITLGVGLVVVIVRVPFFPLIDSLLFPGHPRGHPGLITLYCTLNWLLCEMGNTISLDQPIDRMYTWASRQTDLFAPSSDAPCGRPMHQPFTNASLGIRTGRPQGASLLVIYQIKLSV